MTRMPVVAGRFYEGTRETLLERLNDCFTKGLGPGQLPEGGPGTERKIKSIRRQNVRRGIKNFKRI